MRPRLLMLRVIHRSWLLIRSTWLLLIPWQLLGLIVVVLWIVDVSHRCWLLKTCLLLCGHVRLDILLEIGVRLLIVVELLLLLLVLRLRLRLAIVRRHLLQSGLCWLQGLSHRGGCKALLGLSERRCGGLHLTHRSSLSEIRHPSEVEETERIQQRLCSGCSLLLHEGLEGVQQGAGGLLLLLGVLLLLTSLCLIRRLAERRHCLLLEVLVGVVVRRLRRRLEVGRRLLHRESALSALAVLRHRLGQVGRLAGQVAVDVDGARRLNEWRQRGHLDHRLVVLDDRHLTLRSCELHVLVERRVRDVAGSLSTRLCRYAGLSCTGRLLLKWFLRLHFIIRLFFLFMVCGER